MSESNCTGQRLSFLKLFRQYGHVEIPLIQRDYAQGRESAKTVRERFLDSLLDALNDGPHPLSLDYIYGEVKEVEGKPSCFQPIDGQQRLTTLFLLHWYLACLAGKQQDFVGRLREGKTPRFRYSVRKSSDQFFDRLLDFRPNLANRWPGQIKDQAWFFRAWKQDATIQGALVMLEAIQRQFSASIQGSKTFYDKLCSDECPITFDVLNLGSLGLSDEIYIKMNARGKELTGFEKFKAWLIENHWENHNLPWPKNADAAKQWPILLDGDWLDLFWAFWNPEDLKPSETVSRVYFRTVLALAVSFHASTKPYTSETPLPKVWLDADADDQRTIWDVIFTKEALPTVFENLQLLSSLKKDGVDDLRNTLKTIGIPFSEAPKNTLFRPFFEGDSDLGLKERLWLQALCSFLEIPASQKGMFRNDWFRVIRNLIENSNIGQENFANAVRSISALAKAVKCRAKLESGQTRPVLCALTDDKFRDLQVFDGEQKKEEAKKAVLMLQSQDGSKWEEMICEAERHPVFLGQIGLLLDGDPKPDVNVFRKRWAVVKNLLDGAGSKIGNGQYLLARAALSQCEPIQLGSQQNLGFKDTAVQFVAAGRGSLIHCPLTSNHAVSNHLRFPVGRHPLPQRQQHYFVRASPFR